jgi:hypothetical protein
MKKFFLLSLIGGLFVMTGCETTREITLNKDNSGTIVTTTDMSGMIGLAKMSGKSEEMGKLDEVIDTTISIGSMADSLGDDVTAEEKALLKKGKVNLEMNMPNDKMIIKIEFPFSDPAQIGRLDKLSSGLLQRTIKKQLASAGKDSSFSNLRGDNMTGDDMPDVSIEDYFTTTYSKGIIEKKLKKEKYATVETDEGMKTIKEMAQSGIGNNTLIINLPRPAKKAEGKNLTLSDDKKKVTIKNSVEDFFDDGTTLEFKIEY